MRLRTLTPIAVATALLASAGVAGAMALAGSGQSSQRGSVTLTGIPSNPVANPQTHTLYVPIQCRSTCNGPPGAKAAHVLDLLDTSKCNADTVSRCHLIGTAAAGRGPLAVAIDRRTDTVYVADSAGAITVVNGGRCNAHVRTHCGKPLATIKTGGFDVAEALNPRTHTLYVAAPSGDLFVINVATCNSKSTAGCHQHVRKVKDPRGPDGVDVDLATNTVYVADGGTKNPGDTVSVINGARCNGSTGRGCGRAPHTITVGSAPFWLTVDQATDTVYVANNNDNTVSVINGSTCNSTVTSGCHRRPRTVDTGGGVSFLAVDQPRHTVFVMNETDDTISEINTRTCNGHKKSGCPQRARNERATFNPPTGYNPGAFALVPHTGTAYLISYNSRLLAAISVKGCNALTTRGCRVEAPSVPLNLAFPVIDPVTDTIYAGNYNKPGIEVLSGAKCNAHTRSDCAPLATIPFAHPQANLSFIDQANHTLYAADPFGSSVSVINVKLCNAHDTSGCSAKAPKITVKPGPSIPVLNPNTHTLYVDEGKNHSDQIGVINASTCNAENTSGCGQTPATINVALNTFVLDVSRQTNTIYSAGLGSNFLNNTVDVINGAVCNATDHAGCSSAVVAKAKVGFGPSSVIADDSTHSVYVDNNADGDLPGTVSVINSAKCNGTHTSGCARPAAAVAVGRSPIGMALDRTAHRIFVAAFSGAAVSIIDTSHCNATHSAGCAKPASEQAVGSQPFPIAVNPTTGTVYVGVHGISTPAAFSIFPATP